MGKEKVNWLKFLIGTIIFCFMVITAINLEGIGIEYRISFFIIAIYGYIITLHEFRIWMDEYGT